MLSKNNVLKNIKSQISEQFITLRTNIQFSSLSDEIKSIVFTSSVAGEGKSTVISNLAVTMAQSGKRVLIIDCDLRKPTIHKKFSLPNLEGLTNILEQNKSSGEVIIATDIPSLYIVPSGPIPKNPSELLSSSHMKATLTELTKVFDMILLDTPPILYVADAQVLSALSQGTVVVISYGKSEKNALQEAKEKIEKAGGRILGVVINKIPEKYNYSYNLNWK